MLNFQQAIELKKKWICSKCPELSCKDCKWTAENAIKKVQDAANQE